ncbi:hypothetical protein JHK82_022749 [Glycine max]|nr:hypothetical protein JHK82_022749 [Glycine max]
MGSQYSPLIEVDLQALAARLSTKGSNVETVDVDPSGDKNVSLKPTMGFRVNDGEDSYTTLSRIDPSVSQRIPTQHGSNYDFTAQLARFMASLVIDVPSQAHWITQLTKYDFGDANSCAFLLSGLKFLGSVVASVVGLSHLFRTVADSNSARLKEFFPRKVFVLVPNPVQTFEGGASSIGSSANSKFVADFSSSVGKKSLQHFDSKESDPKEI